MIIAVIVVAAVGYVAYNQYQNRPPKQVKLTAVGDSLTQGVGDPNNRGGYTYMITNKVNRNNPHVHMSSANFGISGETTDQIDHRVMTSKKIANEFKPCRCDHSDNRWERSAALFKTKCDRSQ